MKAARELKFLSDEEVDGMARVYGLVEEVGDGVREEKKLVDESVEVGGEKVESLNRE